MSLSKVHSKGNVPFSWENKPGVSKVIQQQKNPMEVKLPPPPCPSDHSPKVVGHDLQIPLPPCPFLQAPSRSSSRKGSSTLRQQEDPFLAAYKECTKSVANGKSRVVGSRGRKTNSIFSCKQSCDVRSDNLVRLSSVPPPVSRKRFQESR